MNISFVSTRSQQKVAPAQAILQGLASDGGLYVPEAFPKFPLEAIQELVPLTYVQRAQRIIGAFLGDMTDHELKAALAAYADGTFENNQPAPLHKLEDNLYTLELWHGPTQAFKDMALTVLSRLMVTAARKQGDDREIVILVATSGDTGKAALEGFRDVKGTQALVFYPRDGVSAMQKSQMITQEGENVHVIAIDGNFDDAQTGVKALFSNAALAEQLNQKGRVFSSANSINWGRLVPQIVYYFSAYADLLAAGALELGQPVRFAVPTGNFGNILAAYYAKRMGLPIGKLLCASNENRVLTDFLTDGVYTRNRPFHTTLSPSMDILISSNLERLLFEMCGRDSQVLCQWMEQLKNTGSYKVGPEALSEIQNLFEATSANDQQTMETIAKCYRQYGYVVDPHTAVGLSGVWDTGNEGPTVLVSTASAYKFCTPVLRALGQPVSENEFENAKALSQYTGTEIPAALERLERLPVRHNRSCAPEHMQKALLAELGLEAE